MLLHNVCLAPTGCFREGVSLVKQIWKEVSLALTYLVAWVGICLLVPRDSEAFGWFCLCLCTPFVLRFNASKTMPKAIRSVFYVFGVVLFFSVVTWMPSQANFLALQAKWIAGILVLSYCLHMACELFVVELFDLN